jgi:hypothetical protein
MPGYRFFIPILGFFSILAALGAHALLASINADLFQKVSIAVVLAFIVLGSFARIAADRSHIRSANMGLIAGWKSVKGHSLSLHETVADWLAQHEKGAPYLVATGEAGFIGYKNMNMNLLDCNGLMDKHIARQRKNKAGFSADYVLDRKPAYILLYGDFEIDPLVETKNPDENYSYAFLQSKRFFAEYGSAADISAFHIYKRK